MSRICARVCPSGGRAGPCAVRLGSACRRRRGRARPGRAPWQWRTGSAWRASAFSSLADSAEHERGRGNTHRWQLRFPGAQPAARHGPASSRRLDRCGPAGRGQGLPRPDEREHRHPAGRAERHVHLRLPLPGRLVPRRATSRCGPTTTLRTAGQCKASPQMLLKAEPHRGSVLAVCRNSSTTGSSCHRCQSRGGYTSALTFFRRSPLNGQPRRPAARCTLRTHSSAESESTELPSTGGECPVRPHDTEGPL